MRFLRWQFALAILWCFAVPLPAQEDCEWASGLFAPTGVDGAVHAIESFTPGGGAEKTYIGGDFTAAAAVFTENIACWDGSVWAPLGEGVDGQVNALDVFTDGLGEALFAGGSFATAGGGGASNVARWNGTVWSALGGGVDGEVLALQVYNAGGGASLYVGGQFTTAEGIAVNNIARWNGNTWAPLVTGLNGKVNALAVFDAGSGPELYAAGEFTTAGPTAASGIARWNGSGWSSVSTGINGSVFALGVFDSGSGPALYAGGDFNTAGLVNANRIARWDGAAWAPLGIGVGGPVLALETFDGGGGDALYVGGTFSNVGLIPTDNIARWNGSTWSSVAAGTDDSVRALHTPGGPGADLHVGGDFANAGDAVAAGLASFDGVDWSAIGQSTTVSGPILALEVFNDGQGSALYASGDFASAGGLQAGNIAGWTGQDWFALGSGMDDSVVALETFNDGNGDALYAGGTFLMAGGASARRIARWDGNTWAALGDGFNGAVLALEGFDDGNGLALYAAGFFGASGITPLSNIARWQNGVWSDVGGGMNTTVRALAVFDGGSGAELYAAGDFAMAGGGAANRIARWNGSSWSPVGTGLNNRAFVLEAFSGVDGPSLYVGGQFNTAGGSPRNRVARWDGSAWSNLGNGMNNLVLAFQGFDDGVGPAIFAGGQFTSAGGQLSRSLARWDSNDWEPLVAEVDDVVNALAVFDDGDGPALYAGGAFRFAGTIVSTNLAKRVGPSFPEISTPPSSQSVCGGENALFRVTATGTPPLSYQWRKDGDELPDSDTDLLLLPPLTTSDAGIYDVVVTDGCGQVVSAPAELTVLEPVAIQSSPESQVPCLGTSVILSVSASGTGPLSFQWRKNGFEVVGAATDTLTLDDVDSSDAGVYEAIVTGPCDSATSAVATLTIAEPAEIVSEPLGQSACLDTTVLLSVGTSGSPPFDFQWMKDGVDIDGGDVDLLVIDPVTPADAGDYQVIVSNLCGNALSVTAAVVVEPELLVLSAPQDQEQCPGDTTLLSVDASGSGDLAYQWSLNGEDIDGATEAMLSIPSTGPENAGSYTVRVSDACDLFLTDPATVTVLEPAVILGEPADQAVCIDGPVLLEATAAGTAPLAFQWFKDDVEIVGAQESSLAIAQAATTDAGRYRLRVTNSCGLSNTREAVLSILEPPQILNSPVSQEVCSGTQVTLSIEASGTGPLIYEWRQDGVLLTGATSETLLIDSFGEGAAGSYEVTVSNECGTVVAPEATLSLNEAPTIVEAPVGATSCRDTSVTLAVTVSGAPPPAYQWRRNGIEIPEANAMTYLIPAVTDSDVGFYDVVVTNTCGVETSVAAEITLEDKPTVTASPLSQFVCPGDTVELSVELSGTAPFEYQWRLNAVDIPGGTDPTYVIQNLSENDLGAYDVRVRNACGAATSELAFLTQETPIDITSSPSGDRTCVGGELTLSVEATGTPPITYQWRKDGEDIPGVTSRVYIVGSVDTGDAGNYDVLVTNFCGSVPSELARIDVVECFHRGDVNASGDLDITDGIGVFNLLFTAFGETTCMESADVDNNGEIELTDGIVTLQFLFLGGVPPAAPGPPGTPCGRDPDPSGSAGDLGCDRYDVCFGAE